MEIFLPGFESQIKNLVTAFQVIVFVILVAGLIFTAASTRTYGTSLVRPLAKALVIVMCLAYQDQGFTQIENTFLSVANYINPGYTAAPTATADQIRESTTADPQGQSWSWRHINESIYQAVTHAFATVLVWLGTLLTVPMLILQYILRWLLYLVAPFALAFFMVPGFSALGVRFLQQVLAILAWPVGFAITNLVALAVWTDFRNAVGANAQTLSDALYSPLLTFMGALLGTIVMVIGMISTPIVMQMLFAQGHAFTGNSVSTVSLIRSSANLLSASRARAAASGSFGPPNLPVNLPPAPPPPLAPPIGLGTRPGI